MCQVHASCFIYIELFKSYNNSVDILWIHRQPSHQNYLCALCVCVCGVCGMDVCGVNVWYVECV